MTRFRPALFLCCCLTVLLGSLLPAAARDPILVQTFNREFINWATSKEYLALVYGEMESESGSGCVYRRFGGRGNVDVAGVP